MAALFPLRLVSPRAFFHAAAYPIPRIARRLPLDVCAALKRGVGVSGEWLLFLWMLAVTAFSLLVTAAFLL